MWPTESMIHEHRKEMERFAAQMRLIRQFEPERPHVTVTHWLTQVFATLRRPRLARRIEIVPVVQPQCAPSGRVN